MRKSKYIVTKHQSRSLFQFSDLSPHTVRYWGLFLETPDNFSVPKTILGGQYSPIAIQFLLILKAKI